MDTPSHGLWSFVLWHSLPFPFLAVLFGMIPDLLSFGPASVYNITHGKVMQAKVRDETHPAWLKKYTNALFPVTHSLVVASTVSVSVFAIWGNQWWILAWPVHIIVDIFSHPREKATPFLWPLFGYKVHGLNWSMRVAAANVFILLVVAAQLLF
jgi:hypothetical protein